MALPKASIDQSFCTVSALESGHLEGKLSVIVAEASPDVMLAIPTLSFLLVHSRTGSTLVFDLGIRKDWENYPPTVVERIRTVWNSRVPQDVSESLRKGGLDPGQVDSVLLSHIHFDHCGDPSPFTKARFVVGGESAALLKTGYPIDPSSAFDSSLLPHDRTDFLSTAEWTPLGPFPKAWDFYGDGSLYIVDAPGHLPGHINILARTSPDGGWIYLAGDSAHHWSLITGDGHIAVSHDGACQHRDKEKAEETIRRIRSLTQMERVRVLLAHDEPWYEKNAGGDAFWPGHIRSL